MNAEWVKQLKAQFGDAVTTDAAAFAVQGVAPACVCAPADEAQAAAVIRFAAAQRIPVVPCGGGTEQGKGLPPPPDFLALSTRRMNKLIHHEPGDMVATVQGGMSFDDFQRAIGAGGQWLPLDAPYGATIGGIVAANKYGPRAFGYGTLRDMILGMTIINGDGVIRKCGGKVVKNVTGYSLDKLYIGSVGTLGVLTEVTFKLRPFPAKARGWIIYLPDFKTGVGLLRKIAAMNLPIDMVQLTSPEVTVNERDFLPVLEVFACGARPELERIGAELRAVVPDEFKVNRTAVGDLPPAQKIVLQLEWGRNFGLHGIVNNTWIDKRNSKSAATLRFGYVSSQLESALSVIDKYQAAPKSIGPSAAVIDLSPLNEPEATRIASEFEKLGINFAFENVVGVNIPNRWGSPRPEWAIMKQIKAALDPAGIMNPGRFVC